MSEFKIEWFSGTGPGGQFKNKHQNCCRVKHLPTELIQTSSRNRDRVSNLKQALKEINLKLNTEDLLSSSEERNKNRKQQVGSGMRGDKRRTYRFQEGIVCDHVTGRSARIKDVMRGNFEKLW